MEQVESAQAYIKRALEEKIRKKISKQSHIHFCEKGSVLGLRKGTRISTAEFEHQIDGELIDKWYGDSKTQVYLDFIKWGTFQR
ncbi:hypothetical protein P7H15_25395 [Paenibacillus larvae]|nr:hypothetical protein [Paenibacillus larvae]MDT2295470.1 hypothetical protein [Paenibacillus larvae]